MLKENWRKLISYLLTLTLNEFYDLKLKCWEKLVDLDSGQFYDFKLKCRHHLLIHYRLTLTLTWFQDFVFECWEEIRDVWCWPISNCHRHKLKCRGIIKMFKVGLVYSWPWVWIDFIILSWNFEKNWRNLIHKQWTMTTNWFQDLRLKCRGKLEMFNVDRWIVDLDSGSILWF